eukprot:3559841-Pyramimonas_sp.AAC.1
MEGIGEIKTLEEQANEEIDWTSKVAQVCEAARGSAKPLQYQYVFPVACQRLLRCSRCSLPSSPTASARLSAARRLVLRNVLVISPAKFSTLSRPSAGAHIL